MDTHDDFIDIDEAAFLAKTSTSTVRRRLRDPASDIPRPVKFSRHVHLWLRRELADWVNSRIRDRAHRPPQAEIGT